MAFSYSFINLFHPKLNDILHSSVYLSPRGSSLSFEKIVFSEIFLIERFLICWLSGGSDLWLKVVSEPVLKILRGSLLHTIFIFYGRFSAHSLRKDDSMLENIYVAYPHQSVSCHACYSSGWTEWFLICVQFSVLILKGTLSSWTSLPEFVG